jgi:hypothetical protein
MSIVRCSCCTVQLILLCARFSVSLLELLVTISYFVALVERSDVQHMLSNACSLCRCV